MKVRGRTHKLRVREYPGLAPYLLKRLGPSRGKTNDPRFWCPFCIDRLGDETNQRNLGVHHEKGVAHCHRCKYRASTLERLFRDLNGGKLRMEELSIIRGEVRRPVGVSLPQAVLDVLYADEELHDLKPVAAPPETEWLTQCQWDEPPVRLRRGVKYLKDRGVTERTVYKFGIGYCPSGRYAQRLVFPVYQDKEMVYFTTRYAGKHNMKSLNAANVDGYYSRDTCVLNYDGAVGAKMVAVVEGPFDMIAHAHAVCIMGTEFSSTHAKLLVSLVEFGTEEFVVSLDAGAGRYADQIYQKLVGKVPKVTILTLGSGDPDENKAQLRKLMSTRRAPTVADRVKGRIKRV